ncbi:hypothetical protein Mp_6g20960 [Marchantia polymorpha subsp. ruderalis]|uniref:Uncharacterized protein n=2 Tax=Marchantia polymorpha TaxID=3197 RepID=A0AAF6BUC5_MARPO|nr:hypothetical protein MARPO_0091s0059 [Marchantia polymorpha]BBN15609.1 hypothetical protein Mp_6g20960 [Marchantia polymorpha subsp. ruderalis]|eukprot:PTQ33209.1 hypothetical protein MARPO_0091s0059 [Marchantia polymorpha]
MSTRANLLDLLHMSSPGSPRFNVHRLRTSRSIDEMHSNIRQNPELKHVRQIPKFCLDSNLSCTHDSHIFVPLFPTGRNSREIDTNPHRK